MTASEQADGQLINDTFLPNDDLAELSLQFPVNIPQLINCGNIISVHLLDGVCSGRHGIRFWFGDGLNSGGITRSCRQTELRTWVTAGPIRAAAENETVRRSACAPSHTDH